MEPDSAEKKEKAGVLAIVYDYDGTRAQDSTNAFVKAHGGDPVKDLFPKYVENGQNGYSVGVSYSTIMVDWSKSQPPENRISKKSLAAFGASLQEFPGAENEFARKRAEYEKKYPDLEVKFVIASTGMKDLVANTPSGKAADEVWASHFLYDKQGDMAGFNRPLDPVGKVEVLRAIRKGVTPEELSTNPFLSAPVVMNSHVRESERPPAKPTHIVYVGDGDTDGYAMEECSRSGDMSLAVYEPGNDRARQKAEKMVRPDLAQAALPADFSKGSSFDLALDQMAEKLAQKIHAEAAELARSRQKDSHTAEAEVAQRAFPGKQLTGAATRRENSQAMETTTS